MESKLNQTTTVKLQEIIFFKALCILAVLMVHATSDAIANYNPEYPGFFYFNLFNRFFAYGTPLFIFVSGFLYFYAYWNREYKQIDWERYWVKRVLYILMPYLVFSLTYYIAKKFFIYPVEQDWAEHLKMFLGYLENGRSHPHLYFFVVMIQLYVLFPVILYLMKKKTWLFTYAPLIGVGLHVGFLVLNNKAVLVTEKGSLFISYLSFYMLGAWLGGNYLRFKEFFTNPFRSLKSSGLSSGITLVALIGGSLFILAYYGVRTGAYKVHSLDIEFSYILYIMPLAFVIIFVANWINRWNERFILKKFILDVGIRSFGIYLIHPMFLMLYRGVVESGTSFRWYVLWLAGSYVFALIASYWVVGFIYKRIPFYRYIIGNM